ncbi:MAG TPA: hypothetical protein EYO33_04735 [Phycisphaerales bacterium]|nr:hypothetical protein [Phycisphaerales bacterium]
MDATSLRTRLGGLVLIGLSLFLLTSTALADRRRPPEGWTKVGKVDGLLGDDWYTKKTRYCLAYVSGDDLDYVIPVVDGLDSSYDVNARFVGFRAAGPLEFYFFPMTDPAHTHPKFRSRIGNASKFAGLALSGTKMCLVNLGSQQHARPYPTWEVEGTSRHEMNHLFAFQRIYGGEWSWFLEAIAENIEQTVLPAGSRMGVNEYRQYLKGYRSKDASWAALTAERNNNDVDSYRDFGDLLSSIVSFMTAKYGNDAVAKVLKAAPGKSVDEALKEVFNKDAKQLEAEWKTFYGIR